MNAQELEIAELRERLQQSALRPVEQGVFLVLWLLAHGGGKRLREGRVVDAAAIILCFAGFDGARIDEWLVLAARLGFSEDQCAAIERGLRLSIVSELEAVGSVDAFLERGPRTVRGYAKTQTRRLRVAALGRCTVAEIATEVREAKERQRERALKMFRDLDAQFGARPGRCPRVA